MTPDEMSAMNLGIFYDAVAVTGNPALVASAKAELSSLMRGEAAYLARFAKAIDQFEDASAGMLTSLMATVGVGSDSIHIKKSGTFPIVHGVRVIAIEKAVIAASTAGRLDEMAEKAILSQEIVTDLKSALSYFMQVRLRSQLASIRTGRHEEEAIMPPQRIVDHRARPAARSLEGGEALQGGGAQPLPPQHAVEGRPHMRSFFQRQFDWIALNDRKYAFLFDKMGTEQGGLDRLRDHGIEP